MKPGKGGILIALAGGKPEGESEDEAPDAKGGALSAAKALIKAVKADDAAAVDEALRLHYQLCESMGEDD